MASSFDEASKQSQGGAKPPGTSDFDAEALSMEIAIQHKFECDWFIASSHLTSRLRGGSKRTISVVDF